VQYKELRGDIFVDIPYLPGVAAGTPIEWPVFVVPWPMLLTGARVTPLANVVFNGTNFATLSVRNRGAGGAGTALAASRAWSAVSSTAFVPDTMTLSATATDLQLAAGDQLTVQIAHSGTGLLIPVVQVQLAVRGR
jgi:hypothetical protein